jgi:hypothetical protein
MRRVVALGLVLGLGATGCTANRRTWRVTGTHAVPDKQCLARELPPWSHCEVRTEIGLSEWLTIVNALEAVVGAVYVVAR